MFAVCKSSWNWLHRLHLESLNYWLVTDRVTRLSEISHVGRLFTLGSFWSSQIPTFFLEVRYVLILTKYGLGHNLGAFFKISSGRLGRGPLNRLFIVFSDIFFQPLNSRFIATASKVIFPRQNVWRRFLCDAIKLSNWDRCAAPCPSHTFLLYIWM
jgi:hypothetical protein